MCWRWHSPSGRIAPAIKWYFQILPFELKHHRYIHCLFLSGVSILQALLLPEIDECLMTCLSPSCSSRLYSTLNFGYLKNIDSKSVFSPFVLPLCRHDFALPLWTANRWLEGLRWIMPQSIKSSLDHECKWLTKESRGRTDDWYNDGLPFLLAST